MIDRTPNILSEQEIESKIQELLAEYNQTSAQLLIGFFKYLKEYAQDHNK